MLQELSYEPILEQKNPTLQFAVTEDQPKLVDQTPNKELPQGYDMHTWINTDGKTEISEATLEKLQIAWAKSYLQSTEPAQSNDPKYRLDSEDARQERIAHIKKELSHKNAALVYISFNNPKSLDDEIIGFFWGLPFNALEEHDAPKAQAVKDVSENYTKTNKLPPIEWDKTDYLSMMGVVNKSDDELPPHTGKGFGRILTEALIEQYKGLNDKYTVLRTINPLAGSTVYKKLNFDVHGQFPDEKAGTTRYIFGRPIQREVVQ